MHQSAAFHPLQYLAICDCARALLDQGLAAPDDVIVMRHAGMQHTVLGATVGKAARMAENVGTGARPCAKRTLPAASAETLQ